MAKEQDALNRYDLSDQLDRNPIVLKGAAQEPKPKGFSLCHRCTNSIIYRRKSTEFDTTIICKALGGQMHQDIIECSAHAKQNELSLYDMSQMAMVIDDREIKSGYL